MSNSWNDDVRNALTTLVSGGLNALNSGLTPVIGTISTSPIGASIVNCSTYMVNTSGTQLPNSPGKEHLLQIVDSGVYWISGLPTVKSGIGYMWQGIPSTDYRSQLTLRVSNLNLLYMAAQTTSGRISIMSCA